MASGWHFLLWLALKTYSHSKPPSNYTFLIFDMSNLLEIRHFCYSLGEGRASRWRVVEALLSQGLGGLSWVCGDAVTITLVSMLTSGVDFLSIHKLRDF